MVHGVQVERATVRTTWTPWTTPARLCLGRWQTGREPTMHATFGRHSATAPPPSRSRPIPRRRHRLDPCGSYGDQPMVPALFRCGRASAHPARTGPQAGAPRGVEPGSPPGGAERSRVLDEVGKPVTTPRARAVSTTVSSVPVQWCSRGCQRHGKRSI